MSSHGNYKLTGEINDILEDIIKLEESLNEQNTTESMIHERLKNFNSIMGKENNIQHFPGNPGPSTMEIQSEIYNNGFDNFSKSTPRNSSIEYASNEIINIPSDSDDDRDYYGDTSDLNEVSIIDTVKAVANDTASSNLPSYLTDDFSAEPLMNMLNLIPVMTSSSDREAVSVSSKIQNRSEIKIVEENNNNVSYMKTVSEMKRLSENPKPGCSKDSDDTSSKLENDINMDELLKDARLIHALLPNFSNRLIYKTLCNNKFAQNRIELTLWDLLPVERPLTQYVRKRKSSDDICILEYKKNSNPLLKDRVDTKTAMEKKEQHVMDNIGRLEDKIFASMGEIDGMKGNIPEVTVLNDMNNDIDQLSAMPVKMKLDRTLDEPVYIEHDNDINMNVVQEIHFKKSKTNSKTKGLQSTKNSEIKKRSKSLSNNNSTKSTAVTTVLQPAKLTLFETNFMRPSQKFEMYFKPITPILSPPKLHFIKNDKVHLQQMPTVTQEMKQNGPIVLSANLDLSANDSSAIRLPNTSSNNKKASHIGVSNSSSSAWPKLTLLQGLSDFVRDMETEDTNVYTTRVLTEPLYDRPSCSVQTLCSSQHNNRTPNISDHQGANSSKIYNFAQETSNMSTSQIYRRKDEKQQLSPYIDRHKRLETFTNIVPENTIKNTDYKEVKTSKEKSKFIEKDPNKIILNERANKMYVKLIPMFPCVKTCFIKQLCHDYSKDFEQSMNDTVLLEHLVDVLLNCDQENLKKVQPFQPVAEEPEPSYDINEQYADLLTIFPEADPVYLRKVVEEIHGNHELIKEFVQSKLEKPDYPTRAQYLAKKKITEQQKQYTTDFQVSQFLEIFPDPFLYFEDDKRNCQFNPHAIDFLKYYFSKLRVNTLVKTYSEFMYNLSLTAKVLEALNPDMKTKRQCNKMVLTEDIPFLQECAFIQHKAELRKYLDEVEAKEEEEFNELKANNGLLECQCCYDNECMPSKCSTCEDGHVFCNLCIIRSTDVVLGDGNTRVDCLLKCGCEFSISVLQRVLPPTKFSILLCKRQEAEVIAAGVEGLESCPFCHFASIPPPEDKIFKCLNPECMKESCRLCKELNHIPLKCNEKKSESARLYLEERMTEALVRKCYRCNRMFFKEEGCNKMTCICGAQMCYICDKPVTDYKHFQGQGAGPSNLCPLWSDDRRLNAESVIKVCQETVKQIKEKDPKIDINVDALLPKLPPKSKGPHDDIVYNAMIQGRVARFP